MTPFFRIGSPYNLTLSPYNTPLPSDFLLNSVTWTLIERLLKKRITFILKECTHQGEYLSSAKAVSGNLAPLKKKKKKATPKKNNPGHLPCRDRAATLANYFSKQIDKDSVGLKIFFWNSKSLFWEENKGKRTWIECSQSGKRFAFSVILVTAEGVPRTEDTKLCRAGAGYFRNHRGGLNDESESRLWIRRTETTSAPFPHPPERHSSGRAQASGKACYVAALLAVAFRGCQSHRQHHSPSWAVLAAPLLRG